jgi:hydrogenase/urease accessory protein HupE
MSRSVRVWLVAACLLLSGLAAAHESQPASLVIQPLAADRVELVFRTPLVFGQRHPARLRLPADWRELAPPSLERRPRAFVETRQVDPGERGLHGSVIRFPGLERTVTDVFVRQTHADGSVSTAIVRPSDAVVELQGARSLAAGASEYSWLGVQHILQGPDHLLFVLGLLLLVRGWRALVKTITAFTVGHSLTLAAATLGLASVPIPPLNAAIALSILFLAPEVVRAHRGGTSLTIRHTWVIALAFGLLHGFGFASGLTSLGLPRAEIPWALLMFNIGVELGQLAFVLVVLLAWRAVRTLEFRISPAAALAPAYLIGALGAYWTLERIVVMQPVPLGTLT